MNILIFSALLFITMATAFISGLFGMAGGMILMGVLIWILPVAQAMVLHGVIQFTSNGWRSFLHRQHIQWYLIRFYMIGAAFCFAVFLYLAIQVDKKTAFFILGALPFLSLMIPKNLKLDITKPAHSVLCGILVSCFHFTAGVSGPMLDVFYLNKKLNRFEITSTKAFTQCISHLLKIFYFGFFLAQNQGNEFLPLYIYIGTIITTMIGTTLSKSYLHKLGDHHFHNWTRAIVLCIGAVYLGRAFLL